MNNTNIRYIKVSDKIYQITDISFFYMSVEATETNLALADLPEYEVFDFEFFKNYKVKLVNNAGKAEIIDFESWKSRNKA